MPRSGVVVSLRCVCVNKVRYVSPDRRFISEMKGIAWVTGASSGIGWHLSKRLALSGWCVAVTARRAERLRHLAASVPEGRGQIHAFPGDVTDVSTLSQTVERIYSELGAIDRCFLNAGDYDPKPMTEFDVGLFQRILAVNYMGVVNALGLVLPRMLERKQGEIYITASLAGYRGLPKAGPYGSSKAALISLTETLNAELVSKGIKVRVINPGFVKTELTDKNRFRMPFLISTDTAADYIMRELDTDRFEIAFPKRFVYLMKLLRILPYRAYFIVVRKMMGE